MCKEYTLSPYDIDEKTFNEVIDLFIDTRQVQKHTQELNDPDRVVRRKAGDDWY